MASDSDSDSDDLYSMTCQKRPCECKAFNKKRRVVNNYCDGYTIILCDIALEHKEKSICSYCLKLCIGTGLKIDEDFKLCVACCRNDEASLSNFLFKKCLEDKTFLSMMFNALLIDAENYSFEEFYDLYEQFDKSDSSPDSDMLFEMEDNIFILRRARTKDFIKIDDSQKCLIELSSIISKYPEKYEKLKSALMNDFIKFKQNHDDEERRKVQEKKEKARNNAKRVMREYFSESFDEVVDKILDSKKRRVLDGIPEDKDISKFVKWLRK